MDTVFLDSHKPRVHVDAPMPRNWTFICPFEKAQIALVAIAVFYTHLFDESDN